MAPDLYADWEDRSSEKSMHVPEDRLRLRLVCDECTVPLLARALPAMRDRIALAARNHHTATGHNPRVEEPTDG